MNLEKNSEWPHRAVIFLCALIATFPLVIRGNSCGHDFDFHIQSWLSVAQHWHQGVFYPHWIEAANYGAGEPRFVFYPPLTWILGALLTIILPLAATPGAFTLIVLTACGLSMKKLARACLPDNASTISGCAYILSPYTLFVAYERTAYAELAAGIWLPLIVLYALRSKVLSSTKEAPHLDQSILPLALAIAAIWLTNAPAAVIACYTLGAITVWKTVSKRQWQPLLHSAVSLILGLGLASFYILPAAWERRWVDITRAVAPGMRVEDSFLFGHTGEAFHDQVLRSASLIFVTMLVAIAICGGIAYCRRTARQRLLALFVTAAALFALQLRWSDRIWHLAPELGFLQFPWRWSLLLSIVFAIAIGAAFASPLISPPQRLRLTQMTAILIAAIGLVLIGTQLFRQPCDEGDIISAQLAVFQAGTGFEGTDEYTTIGADNSIIQQALPPVRLLSAVEAETANTPASDDQANPSYVPTPQDQISGKVEVQRFSFEHKLLSIAADTPGFAVLRLMDYPAWQVLANGRAVLNRPSRDDGLMTIPIAAGVTHLEINYVATPDVWWARGLTFASVLTLLGLFMAGQKRD